MRRTFSKLLIYVLRTTIFRRYTTIYNPKWSYINDIIVYPLKQKISYTIV